MEVVAGGGGGGGIGMSVVGELGPGTGDFGIGLELEVVSSDWG